MKSIKSKIDISTLQSHIVGQCKQNDRRAQLKLYNQYCNGMLIVALRFVQDTMEAEDIVQEAFIKAFSKLDQYRSEVSFGAWLKRIVINQCIDVLKSQKERKIELQEHHLKIVDVNEDEDWYIEDNITISEVKSAMNKLPDKYKYVLMLYLIEGYDHQEIAEILNITEVASRAQLLRGKQKLQLELKNKKNGTRS